MRCEISEGFTENIKIYSFSEKEHLAILVPQFPHSNGPSEDLRHPLLSLTRPVCPGAAALGATRGMELWDSFYSVGVPLHPPAPARERLPWTFSTAHTDLPLTLRTNLFTKS